MSLSVERLPWDTSFFGFGVGRLQSPFGEPGELGWALRESRACGLRLVYGICDPGDLQSNEAAVAVGGVFVDAKQTYAADLTDCASDPGVGDANGDPVSRRQLRSLAWQAAEHSRFRVDHRMPAGAWRRMYSTWILNSLNGSIADAVLVERQERRIVGMVTVAHRSERGQIGLIAVDRAARGRGIGRRLLQAAGARCIAGGCRVVTVVTQGTNAAACSLYQGAGYALVEQQNVFHFWNETT